MQDNKKLIVTAIVIALLTTLFGSVAGAEDHPPWLGLITMWFDF
jgi:hypothetical protein